jgi:hypothetical protein
MSGTHDPSVAPEPSDPRIDLLRRALELSGVEPMVAGALALEHHGRIVRQGQRFAVVDSEGEPDDLSHPDQDAILHLAERIKEGIPAKFLTDQNAGSG